MKPCAVGGERRRREVVEAAGVQDEVEARGRMVVEHVGQLELEGDALPHRPANPGSRIHGKGDAFGSRRARRGLVD